MGIRAQLIHTPIGVTPVQIDRDTTIVSAGVIGAPASANVYLWKDPAVTDPHSFMSQATWAMYGLAQLNFQLKKNEQIFLQSDANCYTQLIFLDPAENSADPGRKP